MVKVTGITALSLIKRTEAAQKSVRQGIVRNSISKLPNHEAVNISRTPVYALMTAHKDAGGTLVFGEYPLNYVKLRSKKFIEAEPAKTIKLGGREYNMKPREAHYEYTYEMLPHYHIDKLWSQGKGTGTRSVQSIVRKSLEDIDTQGRVTLEAAFIDNKRAPGGFYYKLGFRFADKTMNKKCEKWLENGGRLDDAPFAVGMMFLPKENISKCLNYGKI